MQIQSKPTKAQALQEVKSAILSQCDDDIRTAFAQHNFTVEPLLIQLIREIKRVSWPNEHYESPPSDSVPVVDDATGRNHETSSREPDVEAPATDYVQRPRTLRDITGELNT